jgi:hypothetical protein
MRVPLHPGTHLNDMEALMRLRDIWAAASPEKRMTIVNDIFLEIESFSDCYIIDEAFLQDTD